MGLVSLLMMVAVLGKILSFVLFWLMLFGVIKWNFYWLLLPPFGPWAVILLVVFPLACWTMPPKEKRASEADRAALRKALDEAVIRHEHVPFRRCARCQAAFQAQPEVVHCSRCLSEAKKPPPEPAKPSRYIAPINRPRPKHPPT